MTYTPPPVGANVGGMIVVKYSNGVNTHRIRLHVAPFDPATGTYTTPTGTETHVGDTVANFISVCEPFYLSSWTFTWEKLFHYTAGVPVEIPLTQVVVPGVGSGTGSENPLPYVYSAWNFRSTLLGRARFFFLSQPGVTPGHAVILTAASGGSNGALVAYLVGTGTEIVAHDGGKFASPARLTEGFNKRLRRRYGDA